MLVSMQFFIQIAIFYVMSGDGITFYQNQHTKHCFENEEGTISQRGFPCLKS
jgi:hypothetical protein